MSDGRAAAKTRGDMLRVQYAFGEYVGEFDAATQRRHGYGVVLYGSGNSYEGEWVQGAMHGHGRKKYANGDVYDGEWRDGRRDGAGTYFFARGHVYEGEYSNDACHGRGRLVLAHGAGSYDGEWAAGQKHGMGVERGRSNSRYEGQFVNGARHGRATLVEEITDDETSARRGERVVDGSGNDDAGDGAATERRHETVWENGEQVRGPVVVERAAPSGAGRRGGGGAAAPHGPIADAAALEALQRAGVSPEAVRALGAFSHGVERSFGALDSGVAGMEQQIGALVGSLDALLGSMGDDDVDDDKTVDDDVAAGLEYAKRP
jgi:hypothetical protein